MESILVVGFGGVILIAGYFIPTFIAEYRHHNNFWPIAALNLFAGWTFIGWVVALVWSLTAQDN